MDRKVLAILVILISITAFMTLGCAGKNNNPTPIPTQNPATPVATVTATPAAGVNNSAIAGIDPSWLNVSGESDESLPEDSIPTPDASDFS